MQLGLVRRCIIVPLLVAALFHTVNAEQADGHNNPDTGADTDDSDLLVIEEESDGRVEEQRDVFVATKEWQVVKEGQAIPPGLHVRMNLQTGLKEAKLLEEGTHNEDDDVDSETVNGSEGGDIERDSEATSDTLTQAPIEAKFLGDNRRTHYLGKSDRRGIVNKKTKVFSRKELLDALSDEFQENKDDDTAEHMFLTAQESRDEDNFNVQQATSHKELGNHLSASVDQESGRRRSELPYTLHEEVGMMLEHSQTLARKDATVEELVHALEELEYHVHNLDNAKDLNAIGGLVLVIRQLNHSSPKVRSHAAHVIGAASQRYGRRCTLFLTIINFASFTLWHAYIRRSGSVCIGWTSTVLKLHPLPRIKIWLGITIQY